MVMLQRWTVLWRENGYVTEVQFNRGSKIMLHGQLNGRKMVMLQRW